MKRTLTCLITLFLVLGLAASAQALSVSLNIDGETYGIITEGLVIPDQLVGDESKGTVQITGIADADPAIAYGIAVVDFGASSTFGFTFSIPIVLPATPTTINSSLVGGLTDFTGDGVSIAPVAPNTLLQDNFLGAAPPPPGTFIWSVGPGLAYNQGTAGALYPYGPYSFGPAAGPVGPFGGLFTTTLNFTLSGNGDIAALTGYCEIAPAPMPATILLFGAGLLGLVGFRSRKK